MKAMTDVTSLRLTQNNRKWLSRFNGGLGQQIREDLGTLAVLVKNTEQELSGRFTVPEASAICDTLNGIVFESRTMPILPQLLAAEVENGSHELGKKWKIDIANLVKKLSLLSPLEAYVVSHLAQLFWSGSEREKNMKKAIEKIFRS